MTADVPLLSWRPPVQCSEHISDLVEKRWQPTSRCWADVLLYGYSIVSISATSLSSGDSRRPVAELTSSCTVYSVASILATSLRSDDSRRPFAEQLQAVLCRTTTFSYLLWLQATRVRWSSLPYSSNSSKSVLCTYTMSYDHVSFFISSKKYPPSKNMWRLS
jgi:hypothetical protein